MRFDIITIHPELLSGPFSHSILKRAQDKGLVEIEFHDLIQYITTSEEQLEQQSFLLPMLQEQAPIDVTQKLQSLDNEKRKRLVEFLDRL
jgi:tRNA G37 N-methylase TrmD